MIHIGFTGTRHGWRPKQNDAVMGVLLDTRLAGDDTALRFYGGRCTLHSGDCLGADAEMHRLATGIAWKTVGHIPSDPTHRAFLDYDEVRKPLPYMQRNAAIVESAKYMLATPYEMTEQQRGGTWATIRMARRAKKPLIIVYPDGSTEGSWA